MSYKIEFQKFPGTHECESNSESIGPQYYGADSNIGIHGLLSSGESILRRAEIGLDRPSSAASCFSRRFLTTSRPSYAAFYFDFALRIEDSGQRATCL